jgi:hypothetical protein
VTYDEEHINRAIDVQNTHNARLLAIPGARLVEVGCREVDGVSTGEVAIRVYVRRKRPAASVPAEELIPAALDGIPVDVFDRDALAPAATAAQALPLESGAIMSNDALRDERERPLIGGVQLMPNSQMLSGPNRGSHSPGGTLGCLLWDAANHQRGYALTCQHVIDADGHAPAEPGDLDIGSPNTKTKSTCCSTDNMIGKYLEGSHPHTLSDQAAVTLRAGMRWQPQILEIGLITPHTAVRLDDLFELIRTGAQVRKRGARTGLTGGKILGLNGNTNEGVFPMRIAPNPNAKARSGDRLVFADKGDSGAALVDDANRILGVVASRVGAVGEPIGDQQPDPDGITRLPAKALPISHVLNQLHKRFAAHQPPITTRLEVATSNDPKQEFVVPGGGALVEVPAELTHVVGTSTFLGGRDADGVLRAPVGQAWFIADDARAVRLAAIREALAPTEAGGRLTAFWENHQRELLALINGDRRVTLGWHRGGAAAVFQTFVRLLSRPDLALPETIDGTPVAAVVDRFAATLAERGSPALAADVTKLALPDIGGRTIAEMLVAFGAQPVEALRG